MASSTILSILFRLLFRRDSLFFRREHLPRPRGHRPSEATALSAHCVKRSETRIYPSLRPVRRPPARRLLPRPLERWPANARLHALDSTRGGKEDFEFGSWAAAPWVASRTSASARCVCAACLSCLSRHKGQPPSRSAFLPGPRTGVHQRAAWCSHDKTDPPCVPRSGRRGWPRRSARRKLAGGGRLGGSPCVRWPDNIRA